MADPRLTFEQFEQYFSQLFKLQEEIAKIDKSINQVEKEIQGIKTKKCKHLFYRIAKDPYYSTMMSGNKEGILEGYKCIICGHFQSAKIPGLKTQKIQIPFAPSGYDKELSINYIGTLLLVGFLSSTCTYQDIYGFSYKGKSSDLKIPVPDTMLAQKNDIEQQLSELMKRKEALIAKKTTQKEELSSLESYLWKIRDNLYRYLHDYHFSEYPIEFGKDIKYHSHHDPDTYYYD